jgi:hypothetical protein
LYFYHGNQNGWPQLIKKKKVLVLPLGEILPKMFSLVFDDDDGF